MPPPPDAQFRREFREALIDAYPTLDELRRLVEDTTGERLQNVTMANDMPAVAFDLIGWCRARGRLPELVAGAAAERPGKPRLKALAERYTFPSAVEVRSEGKEERIVREDVPFENAGDWGDQYNRCRAAICRIEPQPLSQSDVGYGSGFLLAPDILLTNFHVIDSGVFNPEKVVFRFDCETGPDGEPTPGRTCKLAANWKLAESPRVKDGGLDFALLRLAEPVGNDARTAGPRGWLKLKAHTFSVGQPVFILQHPAARPLRLAIGTITNANQSPVQVAYNANTLGGSSGSPCFNSSLQVVALHHFGSDEHNTGVKAEAIRKNLAGRADAVLQQLVA
jgi:V8-like Glu-specific endopeptidase